jgi:hypothetical protein
MEGAMEEKQPTGADDLAVSLEDLALVEEHSKLGPCPACDSTGWYVMQSPGRRSAFLIESGVDGGIQLSGGWPLIALACTQCGFLRMYVKAIFDSYIKELKNGAR